MTRRQRVAENLNSALHHLLGAHPGTYLIGEDVADPYGGAFKVTRGLSDRFPDRVLSSPLSEGGIAGVGAGLALAGNRSVVEMMFSDFAALAFDPLLNFAAKSVSMYGRRVPMSMVVRCPTGGNRGTVRRTARACRSTSSAFPRCTCGKSPRSTTTGAY